MNRFTSGKGEKHAPVKGASSAEKAVSKSESTAAAPPETVSAPAAEPSEPAPEASDLQPCFALTRLAQKLGYRFEDSPDAFFPEGLQTKGDELFWANLNSKAAKLLQLMDSAAPDSPFSSDMQLEIGISRDWLSALAMLLPPIGQGRNRSLEQLLAQADAAKIRYGLDRDLLEKVLSEKAFFRVFRLAAGEPAKGGVDGRVEELYPREKHVTLETDDKSVVDFKNLNWLQCVNKGDVICTIIPPVPPEDGRDIGGNVIRGREPYMPRLPAGRNIAESEDGTRLIAEADGQLTFAGNAFSITPVVSINGDIDSAVGNLNVIGSINVKGSVLEGFCLRATGDIHIFGSVIGAVVEAAGDIKINGGIHGGSVSAGGKLITKFIENTTAEVSGPITAESIISSTVICGDKISVLIGKGAIIGGIITSFKGIEAKVIGNEHNLPTKMIVGCDPQLTQERITLQKEVDSLTRKVTETAKNIHYLEQMEENDQAQQQLLSKLRLDYSLTNMNLAKKSTRIQIIEEQLQDEGYQIVASLIYPPLIVTMGTITEHFLTESRMARIYKSEGDIQLGMK